jgi:GGDEF domain-containing protein
MAEDPPPAVDLMRIVRLLVQGIALHAVEGDPQDYQIFRRDIYKLLEGVEANPPPAELLITTGSVLKALEDYNSRTTRHLRMLGAELYHMIAMLTRTVATLGSGSEQSVGRLVEIEGKIEKAAVIEDVRVLKLRLRECLDSIRDETKKQKTDSSHTVASLQQEIRGSQERLSAAGAGPVLDPTTGLPARTAASAALAEWALHPKPPYAALFVVDRIALLNSRFGYAVGDRVLNAYLEELRNRLAPADQIFRWSGPAFLALLNRPDRIEKVREQLRFALSAKIERNFELTNRSALLPISATWVVFPVATPLEGLIEQLDSFLASQNHPVPSSTPVTRPGS